MNGISHKQAIQFIERRVDGMLSASQRSLLEEHLGSCDSCRLYAAHMDRLSAHLRDKFHRRWDDGPGPSPTLIEHVTAKARRIPMTSRISSGAKLLAGAVALIALAVAINFVVSRLQSPSPVANTAGTVDAPLLPHEGLLAFTSVQSGNAEIYVMRADGSGMTNLTNDPAQDSNPGWSPDAKRIAFESDRDGFRQIYLMNAGGSDLVQLTNGEAEHFLPMNIYGETKPWSPDGSRLLINERAQGEEKWMLYSIGLDGQTKTALTSEPNLYEAVSWSPDGKHVAYIVLEPVGNRHVARIHVVDADGNNDANITAILPEDEDLYSWNYTWTPEGNLRFIAGRGALENNNSKFAAYEATLAGKTLVELARTSTPLEDWWNGTAFVRGFTGETLTWLRADGTFSEFKPFANCQMGLEPQYNSFFRRSPNGYLLYGAGCPNGDLWLYGANPDGTTVKQLLASPFNADNGGFGGIYWSPDGWRAALTIDSSGITYLYVLDLREALKNPLSLPEPIAIGGGEKYYNVAWQPVP